MTPPFEGDWGHTIGSARKRDAETASSGSASGAWVQPAESPCRCIAAGEGGVHYPSDHPQPAAVKEAEALAAMLCDFVDGNGYWTRAGDAMRERYRLAARCLLASDWLAQRDERLIADAAEQAPADMAHWEVK